MKSLGIFILRGRRLRGDMIEVFKVGDMKDWRGEGRRRREGRIRRKGNEGKGR